MKNIEKVLKNIESLGDEYYNTYLTRWKDMDKDYWEALKFFFSHSFMRGRKDKLSNEYYSFTIQALEDYFDITKEDANNSYEKIKQQKQYFTKESILAFKRQRNIGRKNSIKYEDFKDKVAGKNPIIKYLIKRKNVKVEWDKKTYTKEIHLGNDEDIMMVLDVLKFILSDNRKNIYNYLKNIIENIGAKKTYDELKGLRAISDKLSSFIIRDIGLMNPGLITKDFEMAFPVDTWVKRIALKLDCDDENIKDVKNYFITKCVDNNLNPLKFAAGLWYLGFHSLDILLNNCLSKIEINFSDLQKQI